MTRRTFIFAGVCGIWGSEWLVAEVLGGIPPFRLLTLRCLIAAIVLLPGMRRGAFPVLANMLLGVLVIALPAILTGSFAHLSPGLSVLLFAIAPILTSIFEGRGLTSPVALLTGLAGTAFLVRGGLSFSLSQAWPVLGMLGTLMAISAVLVKAKQWLSGANIAASVCLQMLTAATVFGAYSWWREGAAPHVWILPEGIALLGLGVLAGSAAYCGFYFLLSSARASQVTSVQWVVPVIAVAESSVSLGHLPAWDSMLGGGAALLGAWLLLRSPADGGSPLTLQITAIADREKATQVSYGA